ncbi:MAG: Phosphopantothenoylcysteine decarboxylase / Phosphopantothenoylcysteine synthetase [uncultured Thermomicrobiales bacterium]|uniref:Coenzyme A biosynthesis bifunctional protein CoaBC n=1 Tax=uncultured Thermomicrobiales bacterium TaxID=1645740 RepID=A0A6J4VDL0_9BACT|nr:MAG: Phosphopantothenoylcysteine decarboxylase / Phosphopantothenoylcysteine synthetase [uncultured Thermomicrobiales bacterium]
MADPVRDKFVVLGVSGSIAAYKAVDLASRLTQAGAKVDVVMTASATEFIRPITFGAITHRPVVDSLWDRNSEMGVEHVGLAKRAAAVLVAPASANLLAKMAWGFADDPLLTTLLDTRAPIVVAPAMEGDMWGHPATQENIARLRARGVHFVEPEEGRLASGLSGRGRLAGAEAILGTLRFVLGRAGDLAGRAIVVTAGGTQEPLDPVRLLTNRSSGKMGYALAEAARDRGADVTLITAPTALAPPHGARVEPVETAREMLGAVGAATQGADVLIMAAAVADYRPANPADQKIKKRGDAAKGLTIELVPNPDILAETPGPFVRVGFAAESQDLLANAEEKLRRKGLDLIVANDITAAGSGFGSDTNHVVLLGRGGEADELPTLPKREVADRILDRVAALLAARGQP